MTFKNITGHSAIKERLYNLIKNDKLSHAYIFSGPDGVGKTTVARLWADMITEGSFGDIKEITNEEYKTATKAKALSVETVRAAANDMYLKPYMAEKRVFIIPDGDTMTIPAQNALLKVFEEPPEYCVIIIIANNYEALLPTIRSRAIPIKFGGLTDEEIADCLKEKGYSPDPTVVALANGSVSRGLQLVSNEEVNGIIENIFKLLPPVLSGKTAPKYDMISFLQKNKGSINLILDIFILFFEQSLLQLCGKDVTIPIRAFDSLDCPKLITLTEKCRKALKSNVNYNMAISELVLNM